MSTAGAGPWFLGRPRATIAVTGGLFAAVFALRFVTSTQDPITLFYCLPVALLAVASGRWAGLLAGATALALTGVYVVVEGLHPSVLAWVTRAVPMLLLGMLLGDATDRLRSSELDRLRLEAAQQRHRDAIEINDSVVQGLAAAKWALEAGRVDSGLEIVTGTLTSAEVLVSDLLRDAGMGPAGLRGRRAAETLSGDSVPGR